MIRVDRRTGSADMLLRLQQRRVACELTTLAFGDVAFAGNGPEGCPVDVGIELKQLSDALNCMSDGRFAGHQLPGLVAAYNYVWLVIEGAYRADHKTGVLQHPRAGRWKDVELGKRRYMYREFDCWLRTMEIKAGIRVWRCYDRMETVQFVMDLYGWWNAKEFKDHRAHLAFHGTEESDSALLLKPSLARRVAAQLPGIGWERSRAVAERFPTVMELARAKVDEFAGMKGVGKLTAKKIVEAMQGRKSK